MSDSILQNLYELSREMTRIFDDDQYRGAFRWPETNMYESEDAFVLVSKLPGLSKDDIEISVSDNTLTISGKRELPDHKKDKLHMSERFSGSFERSFMLNRRIDSKRIKAEAENGLLIIRLPKAEEARPRKIKIA